MSGSGSGAPRRNYAAVPAPQSAPTLNKPNDPYHGQEVLAKIAARFITHLFTCPDYAPSANHGHARLPYFIAYALHRTKLHSSVMFAALVLLHRLKARFPSARGSSGHRLFISAYMISSKVMCDDTYSNKSWCIVAQGMFTLREINQMEREMCTYLDWELTVDDPILSNFEKVVRQDFKENRPSYPNYPTVFVSRRALRAVASQSNTPFDEKSNTTSPVPGFGSTPSKGSSTPVKMSGNPGTPTKVWQDPNPPDTPSPSFSNSSPTSSASPATPMGGPETNAKIRGVDISPSFGVSDISHPVHPLKTKMFAFAVPSGW
jgi:hypothetical protein